jgi:hypothetical protein
MKPPRAETEGAYSDQSGHITNVPTYLELIEATTFLRAGRQG